MAEQTLIADLGARSAFALAHFSVDHFEAMSLDDRPNRVLLIDDDEISLSTRSTLLRANGLIVLTAMDGASGLESARHNECDVTLVDLRLPDISGNDVARTLVSERRGGVVIVFTAFPDLDAAFDAGAAGAVGFTDGLLLPDEFVQMVSNALSGKVTPRYKRSGDGREPSSFAGADWRVRQAIYAIRDMPAASHSLASLARSLGLSPSGLRHLFRSSTGVGIREFRMHFRLTEAARRLRDGSASIKQIACELGFSPTGLRRFRKAFQSRFGVCPREYRLRYRAATQVRK